MKNILMVLNYNNFEETQLFVRNALAFSFFEHIVVVDNDSSDDSYPSLVTFFKQNKNVTILLSPNNRGYAGGNNYGLEFIVNRFDLRDAVYIANPDVKLNIEALQAINHVLLHDVNNHVGLVTTNIVGQKAAWKCLGFYKSVIIESYIFRKFFHNKYLKLKYYPEIISLRYPVDVVTGAFFATTLDTIKEIGYFDNHTFLYMEEDILAKRIKEKGKQSYLIGTEQIVHLGGTSTGNVLSELKRKRILNKSKKYYYKEYLSVNVVQLLLFNIISTIDISILYLKKYYRKIKDEKFT